MYSCRREFFAYGVLRDAGLSVRPGTIADPPVPYCYGAQGYFDLGELFPDTDTRALFANTALDETVLDPARHGPKMMRCWPALLLEYVAPQPQARLTPDVVQRALLALGRIHAAGVLHSDTRPENLVVGADGTVRWLDFNCSVTISYWRVPDWFWENEVGNACAALLVGKVLDDFQ